MAGAGGVLGMRTDIAAVAEDIVRVMRQIHRNRGLAIELDIAARPEFPAERQDCEELLGNLVDNACKWAGSRVRLALDVRDGVILIEVEDDGPGIPPEQRAAALARGQRLDEAVPGSGLGLAIVSDLAELHGGSLDLASSRLGGLCARLTLPLRHGKPLAAEGSPGRVAAA
jgi:signal transduction histidine kinase